MDVAGLCGINEQPPGEEVAIYTFGGLKPQISLHVASCRQDTACFSPGQWTRCFNLNRGVHLYLSSWNI